MEKQGLKSKLRRFASSTTIHGLHELIVERSKWLKLVWTVVMVVSVCVCCWQLSATILEYCQKPTSMKPSVISYDNLPTINFHVVNVINITKLKNMGLGLIHYELILDRFPMMRPCYHPTFPDLYQPSTVKLAKDQLMKVLEKFGFADFTEFIKYIAHKPEELFGFNQGIKPEITLRINEMGPWYEVRLNRTNSTMTSIQQIEELKGFTSGVLVYDLATYDRRFDTGKILRGLLTGFINLWITVGSETHDTTKWLAIKEQQNTRVYIQSQLTRFIDRPSHPCSMKYETVAECQNLCILESLKNPGSDCEWCDGQSINISRPCQGALDLKAGFYPEHCLSPEVCPRACEDWNHRKDVTFAKPSGESNFGSWVGILASSTDVAVMEEYHTYSSTSLFSNIGGILSLYLGASVLSIIHVIYYLSCKTRTWEKVSVTKRVQEKY